MPTDKSRFSIDRSLRFFITVVDLLLGALTGVALLIGVATGVLTTGLLTTLAEEELVIGIDLLVVVVLGADPMFNRSVVVIGGVSSQLISIVEIVFLSALNLSFSPTIS